MWCTQCKTDKPASAFLHLKKSGWKVTKCNRCANENMRRYWHKVETDPDKVRRGAVDE